MNLADVLNDIIRTALCICSLGKNGDCKFADIQHGIIWISGFIYSKKYLIEDAILTASKVAYLASLINNEDDKILHFTNLTSYSELLIKDLN